MLQTNDVTQAKSCAKSTVTQSNVQHIRTFDTIHEKR